MGSLNALKTWLQDNALTVVLLFVGIVVLSRSHQGNHKAALTTGGVVLIGLAIVGIAVTPGAATKVSSFMTNLVTG